MSCSYALGLTSIVLSSFIHALPVACSCFYFCASFFSLRRDSCTPRCFLYYILFYSYDAALLPISPCRIAVGRTGIASEHVTQHVLVLPSYNAKKQWLVEMLPVLAGLGRMILFVASRSDCESIAQQMRDAPEIGGKGLLVDSIHGDRHQSDRTSALSALRKGKLAALVATDVAARGLDVSDVITVVNFDAAKDLDSHVHRIGRAGRLSREGKNGGGQEHKKGQAYTLLTPKDANFAHTLVEAFRREGRDVSEKLLELAMKSTRMGGNGKRKWDQTGLGYSESS